jgi:hypothetical protein
VLFGQAFAASVMVPPAIGEMSQSETHTHLMPADMTHHDAGVPCKHRGGAHDLACCISTHCSLLSPWLAAVAPALAPASLSAVAYRGTIVALPHRLGLGPATPPPRQV